MFFLNNKIVVYFFIWLYSVYIVLIFSYCYCFFYLFKVIVYMISYLFAFLLTFRKIDGEMNFWKIPRRSFGFCLRHNNTGKTSNLTSKPKAELRKSWREVSVAYAAMVLLENEPVIVYQIVNCQMSTYQIAQWSIIFLDLFTVFGGTFKVVQQVTVVRICSAHN